jgi:hypothetical protein
VAQGRLIDDPKQRVINAPALSFEHYNEYGYVQPRKFPTKKNGSRTCRIALYLGHCGADEQTRGCATRARGGYGWLLGGALPPHYPNMSSLRILFIAKSALLFND